MLVIEKARKTEDEQGLSFSRERVQWALCSRERLPANFRVKPWRESACCAKIHCPLGQIAAISAPDNTMQQVNLGMIGGGTVGSGVFHALQLNGGLMASRIGVKVNVRKVAVKAFDEPRPYAIPDVRHDARTGRASSTTRRWISWPSWPAAPPSPAR